MSQNTEKKRVLGCDPGKQNFGWAIYTLEGLESSGVIESAVSIDRLSSFHTRFLRLLKKQKPDAVCIERFTRRIGKGATKDLEMFNLIIGVTIGACFARGLPVYLVTASSHKGWTARNFDVKLFTGKAKGKIKKKWNLTSYEEWSDLPTEHQVDAANVAKYGLEYWISKKERENDV